MSIVIAIAVVAAIGIIAGVGLSFVSAALEVPPDEKLTAARNALPGANCGGCGFSGCDAYAEAVVYGKAETDLCAPGGADAAKALAEVMGISAGEYVKKTACVFCNGGESGTTQKYEYRGVKTCAAESTLFGGARSCSFGCLGLGDCVKVCAENGIFINDNGVAEIKQDNCIGCGKCVKACPTGVIRLAVETERPIYRVKCSNCDKGAAANKACKVSCIGCGVCVKQCEFGAIKVVNNCAVIDPELCKACGKCAEKCPKKCIVKA